jgi:hypothetical protein
MIPLYRKSRLVSADVPQDGKVDVMNSAMPLATSELPLCGSLPPDEALVGLLRVDAEMTHLRAYCECWKAATVSAVADQNEVCGDTPIYAMTNTNGRYHVADESGQCIWALRVMIGSRTTTWMCDEAV